MARDSWLGSKKSPALTPSASLLVIMEVELLYKRNIKGEVDPKPEWSEITIKAIAAMWRRLLLMYPAESKSAQREEAPLSGLLDIVHKIPYDGHLYIAPVDFTSPLKVSEGCKKALADNGVQIKTVKNPREITFWNIEKFILPSQNVVFAFANSHASLNIPVDKPKNFEELSMERKRRVYW